MSAPPPATAPTHRLAWSLVIPAVIACAYALGHLGWYRQTPLGQVPVLDEQENLGFADAIARGALPHEPFYRAPGYAVMLAALRLIGVPAREWFHAALLLGAVLHALNAFLAAKIARTLFGTSAAALIAGTLFALHPVFVHYATQALDATPALTFFLGGLCCVAPEFLQRRGSVSSWRWIAASALWAAATIARPNYFLEWCALPLLAAWLANGARGRTAAAACAGAVGFVGVATWQWHVSGEAGFLPWQGAYNLWAANQPGAHGRYYVQRVALPAGVAAHNPARAESIYFYQKDTGSAPPDVQTLNAYWRRRFVEHVVTHPLVWVGLLARKGYALVNNWEQYNNKTFAFHKARSPWLRWNPLCWGVLFVLGVAGMSRLAAIERRAAAAIGCIALVCAGSVLLFFVSARFRLPLAALAAIGAGGALAAPTFWRTWPWPRRSALGIALVALAALAFSTFDNVRDRTTFVQDHALLARAAATVGDDALAWQEANAALALQPNHPDALRLAVASYFNQLMRDVAPRDDEPRWCAACAQFLSESNAEARSLRAAAAVALWRAGRTDAALAEWRALDVTPSAVAARVLVGDVQREQIDFQSWPRAAWDEPLVRLAALRLHIAPPAGVALGDASHATAVTARLFAAAPENDSR